MAGGGAEGLLMYPSPCLEAVFTEITRLRTKRDHQSHSSRDSILHLKKKMGTRETVPETPLREIWESLGTSWHVWLSVCDPGSLLGMGERSVIWQRASVPSVEGWGKAPRADAQPLV